MANGFTNIKNGLNVQPKSADPSSAVEGDLYYSDGTARPAGLYQYKSSTWVPVADPMTTSGDIIYHNGTQATRLAVGSSGDVLQVAAGVPVWSPPAAAIETVVSKTTTYTATTGDDVILCDATSGAFTVTLYTAVGNDGRKLVLKKTDSSSNAVTIDANSTETIDGSLTKSLNTVNESITITSDGSNWIIQGRFFKRPTIQKFTSGSGTYTTPAGVAYIKVRMVGGGGGGSGGGTGGITGVTGGNTTFDTLTCNAGFSAGQGGAGPVGGTATIGSGWTGTAQRGGGAVGTELASASNGSQGGCGGISPFGGNGSGSWSTATASSALANSGSGGGGGGSSTSTFSGQGGSAGGYIEAVNYTPSSSYSYSVGAGGGAGAGGTNGGTGGNGGSGYIIVEEYYQ